MTTGEADPDADATDPAGADEDDHSTDHAESPLGPIDWGAWLVSAIGVGTAAVIALVLFVSIQHG
jgi:hypothetical protein